MEITSYEDLAIREWIPGDKDIYSWIKEQFEMFHTNTHKLVHVVSYINDKGKTCLVHYFQKI